MSRLFSLLSKAIAPIFVDTNEQTPEEEIKESWEIVSQCANEAEGGSLMEVHNALIDLINDLRNSIGTDHEASIFSFFAEQQIPSKLVNYGLKDAPKGFSDEVVLFFNEFTKDPLVSHLFDPFLIDSINSVLEKIVPHKAEKLTNLIKAVFSHVNQYTANLSLFVTKENKSPLFQKLVEISASETNGELLLKTLSFSKRNEHINKFFVENPSVFEPIMMFIQECVITKTTEEEKHDFLTYIDKMTEVMADETLTSFVNGFSAIILEPLVMKASNEVSLMNCIFLLVAFSSPSIIRPIAQFLEKKLPVFVESNDETLQYIAFRTCSLLLEHTNPVLTEKYSGRITSNYMGLFTAEWFVRSTVADINPSVRVAVSKSLMTDNKVDWNIEELMKKIFVIVKELIDCSDRVMCALLEFIYELGVNKSHNISYFILSSECENGFYDASCELATTIVRRLGKRPDNIDNIKLAYERFDSEEDEIKEEDEVENLFKHVVYVLEFFKELNTIITVKNSYRMYDTQED